MGNKRYTIPLRLLLKDGNDKNYRQIKLAFDSLLKKTIRYEDEYTIEGFGIIQEYKLEKRESFVSWVAHPKIVEVTMNLIVARFQIIIHQVKQKWLSSVS